MHEGAVSADGRTAEVLPAGSGSEVVTTLVGGAPSADEVVLDPEEDWVAVQRKKKSSSRTELDVSRQVSTL